MSLVRCQIDAYQTSTDARVLRAWSDERGAYAVLDETVLYPEGGGQPADRGSIGGIDVLHVGRVDGEVVHALAAPIAPGPARVEVDWARRYDHMQQHTAQHLITALANDRFGAATISFHLGAEGCSIDLDARALTDAQRVELEAMANAEIRAARPVSHRLVSADALDGVRSRGLPEGVTGPIRLVEIEGLDVNTCGGTHVANTCELQAIALTGTEKITRGVRLHYLAGGRVLAALGAGLGREGALTRALTCGPDQHLEAVRRLQDNAKVSAKEKKALLGELAGLLGQAMAAGAQGGAAQLHRPEADLGLLGAIASAALADAPALTVLLTGGGREGVFLALGPPAKLNAAKAELLETLEARGGGRPGRIQGKASRLDRRDAAFAVLLRD